MPEPTTIEQETHLRSLGRQLDRAEPDDQPNEWRPGHGVQPAAADAMIEPGPVAHTEPTAAEPFRDAKGYSAADYENAAAELIAEGKPELAAQAQQHAAAVRQAEEASQKAAFSRQWEEQVAREKTATPELQDATSTMSEEVAKILRDIPALSQVKDGFRHAAALAKARVQSTELPQLRSRLEALTQENQRLVRLTSIPGSPPARTSQPAEEHLSERDLRRLARDFDNEGAL